MSDALTELQSWYLSNCDGDCEHTYGVGMGTLDNRAGHWRSTLKKPPWPESRFTRVGIERDEDDWLHCPVGPPDRTVVAFKPKPSEPLAVREPDRVG